MAEKEGAREMERKTRRERGKREGERHTVFCRPLVCCLEPP